MDVVKGVRRYRKKPVEILAVLHKGDVSQTFDSLRQMGAMNEAAFVGLKDGRIEIETLEGNMVAEIGDYIIKEPFPGDARFFYPCKPSIFEATYEEVDGA